MAEAHIRLTDTEKSSVDSSVNNYGLALDEIKEEEIQEEVQDRNTQHKDKTGACCDLCLMHNLMAVAFYLCYLCEQYLCEKCVKGHDESHKYIKLVSKESEKDRQLESFLEDMMNESEREETFEREKESMVVNVQHGLDQEDCYINGLCGLDNTMWVVSDYDNYCIKIFNVGSNLLQRCIRLGSRPWDVTEIKVKNEPTEQGVKQPKLLERLRAVIKTFFSVKREPTAQVVITTSGISDINRAKSLQILLAVTLPWTRRILIIDVTQNPAVITKTIETKKHCYAIDFSGDNIVTVCRNVLYGHGPWFVSVMSTDGVTIKTMNTNLHIWSYPYLAVCPGRVFITDTNNHKVLCLNDEGKLVCHKTIAASYPSGISVDLDNSNVYVSAPSHDKLYLLDFSLESFEPLFDFKSVNSDWPKALCLYRDKLYVNHSPVSTQRNFVTIVIVL